MAEETTKPTSAAVTEFNLKVAELIKVSKPEDIVSIIKDPGSVIAWFDTNNNNPK